VALRATAVGKPRRVPVVQHLPGVGQNLQDHPGFGCVWEYEQPLAPRNTGCEATYFWKSDPALDTPDLQTGQGEFPFSSAETAARFDLPEFGWALLAGVVRPKSRGHISLTGPDPTDPVQIQANMLSHPDDLKAAITAVQLCREIGNSAALRPFAKREAMPGNLTGAELERFIRDAASTYWHQSCTAKMGHDAMSVVDGTLKVSGIEHLRIADGSIMPRVTTGNTMAPASSSANAQPSFSRPSTHSDIAQQGIRMAGRGSDQHLTGRDCGLNGEQSLDRAA